jgi:hypothetical protein
VYLNRRRVVPAAVLAAALATGAAACGPRNGGGTSGADGAHGAAASPTASKDPLAGLGSGQIVIKAVADTKAATSLDLQMVGTDSGRKLTINFTLVRGRGCQGTMAEAGQGSVKVVYDGKTGWLEGDKAFWVSNGGNDPGVLSALVGKYLKTTSASFTQPFTKFCHLTQLLGTFTAGSDGMPESHTTIDGQPAIEMNDTGDKAFIAVSDTAQPVILEVDDPSSGGGNIEFGSYGAVSALTLPPASQVVDGSAYGL